MRHLGPACRDEGAYGTWTSRTVPFPRAMAYPHEEPPRSALAPHRTPPPDVLAHLHEMAGSRRAICALGSPNFDRAAPHFSARRLLLAIAIYYGCRGTRCNCSCPSSVRRWDGSRTLKSAVQEGINVSQFVHTVAVIATGLLAGAFLLGVTSLRRVVASFEPSTQIRARQAFIPEFRAVLRPMMLLAALATGIAAMAGEPSRASLAWLGFAMSAAAPLLTIMFNVPVNRQILEWDPASPPPDWQQAVARWNRSDTIRLVACVAAFICSEVARK